MHQKVRAAHTARYYDTPATLIDRDGSQHWITRAANFVVVATRAAGGAVFRREAAQQPDEYMVLLPEEMRVHLDATGAMVDSPGDSLTIVPPGDSQVTVSHPGWIYRVFSKRAADLAALADNAADYLESAPGVAELKDWPAPVGGFRLRTYPLAAFVRSDTTMRLFRSSNLMINIFLPNQAPRDIRKMTPHSHDDFEQGSLALRGSYVHHIRYPWTPDLTAWRDDEHGEVRSPSLVIIPPRAVHTSQSLGTSGMRLVDIFSPPRDDFSLKPGMVCNADDYPLPERLQGVAAPANAA